MSRGVCQAGETVWAKALRSERALCQSRQQQNDISIIIAQTECPLCAGHCVKHFTCIMSVSLHNTVRGIFANCRSHECPAQIASAYPRGPVRTVHVLAGSFCWLNMPESALPRTALTTDANWRINIPASSPLVGNSEAAGD